MEQPYGGRLLEKPYTASTTTTRQEMEIVQRLLEQPSSDRSRIVCWTGTWTHSPSPNRGPLCAPAVAESGALPK